MAATLFKRNRSSACTIPEHSKSGAEPVGIRFVMAVVSAAFLTGTAKGASESANIATSTADSAMFRGGAEHPGIYTAARSPSLSSVVWRYKTAGRVMSSPLVVGDAVYVGSTDGSLYALGRQDGALRWKFATRGPVNSSPASSGGVVYA